MTADKDNPLAEPTPEQPTSEQKIALILERWPAVELMLERGGLQAELISEVKEYIGDLKQEAATVGILRKVMVGFSVFYVAFVNLLLLCMLFYHQWFFLLIGDYGRVALILAAVSSSVLIIVKILAGLFRTHGDRNKDEMLPPHLQNLLEVFKATQGN